MMYFYKIDISSTYIRYETLSLDHGDKPFKHFFIVLSFQQRQWKLIFQ